MSTEPDPDLKLPEETQATGPRAMLSVVTISTALAALAGVLLLAWLWNGP